MEPLIFTLVIAFIGVVFLPPLAAKIRVPVIALELIFGILIGRSLLNAVPDHAVIDFFSSFGLVYLMFLAGLETDIGRIRWVLVKKVLLIAALSVFIPFLCGIALSFWVKMNPYLLGTILSTTSLGLVLPVLNNIKLSQRLKQVLLVSVVIVDILSMFILAFVLAVAEGTMEVRYIYSIITILVLFVVPFVLNKLKLRRKITRKLFKKEYTEMEMRLAFALIFLLGAISLDLGFHTIIGAYIAGLLIAEMLPRAFLQQERLQSFGYSFFIPLFFIFTGAKVDLIPVFSNMNNLLVMLVIIAVGILSKVLGVTIAGRSSGLKMKQGLAFGLFHTARLSLILAATDISFKLGLIDNDLFASFVMLALISAIMAPILGKYVLSK